MCESKDCRLLPSGPPSRRFAPGPRPIQSNGVPSEQAADRRSDDVRIEGQPLSLIKHECVRHSATWPVMPALTMASSSAMPFVYVLRCADGSLYVGRTKNLADRETWHNHGRGAAYTAGRRPVRIVYTESHDTEVAAARRERQIKRWSTDKKEALVHGRASRLKGWSAKSRPRQGYTWRDLLESKRPAQ